jgi:very-short-patch-repair endonuclease/DNA polymerase III delta prime subunit
MSYQTDNAEGGEFVGKTLLSGTQSFDDFFINWRELPSVGTEDVLSSILPLMKQVEALHKNSQIAPLSQTALLSSDNGHLWFANAEAKPIVANLARVRTPIVNTKRAIDIVEEISVISDDTIGVEVRDHDVRDADDEAAQKEAKPRYLTHFQSWEVRLGHHDPVTDIFMIGMIAGALSTQLDFRDRGELERFVTNRKDLSYLNNRLHPVLCRAIERMTSLRREERVQDIGVLVKALENHRKIGSVVDLDLNGIKGFHSDKADDARTRLLKRLRARLYDMTRRNRLIYHRRVSTELNLTETSVPLVLNISAIQPEELFTARTQAFQRLLKGDEVKLSEYIRFEEMAFMPSVLAKLRSNAAKDEREFGGSPLRLVPVFLKWRDLKNSPFEPISSPLLLMRVVLKRRKGVKDAYTLSLSDTKAEINPALSFILDQLYGIKLPDFVDLSEPSALDSLHQTLQKQIMASEPGVSLEMADKPKLRLLHRTVRRRLDQYNKRRAHRTRGVRSRGAISYSYERKNYAALGVQMFREYVALAEAPSSGIFGAPKPQLYNMVDTHDTPKVREKKVTQFEQMGADASRYEWALDLCCVTLANFNYRKMSLVRDYDAVIGRECDAESLFDRFFTEKARPEIKTVNSAPLLNHFPIMEQDPTQARSIAQLRSAQSYVIQGPPGTGKSQTIANLLAEAVSQNKRVLFVCEKRAALDVVYNRLRGAGLDSLCALVHDAQDSKREFIAELSSIYESWTKDAAVPSLENLQSKRAKETEGIEIALSDLHLLTGTLSRPALGTEESLHDVIASTLATENAKLLPRQPDFPQLSDWKAHAVSARSFSAALRRLTGNEILSRSAERLIKPQLWKDENVVSIIPKAAEALSPQLKRLQAETVHLFGGKGEAETFLTIKAQSNLSARLLPAFHAGMEDVFEADSSVARQWTVGLRELDIYQDKVLIAQKETSIWKTKLSARDTRNALALATQKEGKVFSFLSRDWRHTMSTVLGAIDSSQITVKPRVRDLLADLQIEHDAIAARDEATKVLARRFGYDDIDIIKGLLDERDALSPIEGPMALPLWSALSVSAASCSNQVKALSAAKAVVDNCETRLSEHFEGTHHIPLTKLVSDFEGLSGSGSHLKDLQPAAQAFAQAPAPVWRALRQSPLAPDSLETAIMADTIERSLSAASGLLNVDSVALNDIRRRIQAHQKALFTLNAQLILRRSINSFQDLNRLRNTPDRDLSMAERKRKSEVNKGMRALEHEFGKTRAYRSPRELLAGAAGSVLPSIKSIWMMSPLSVADVLPLSEDLFDVVIFDEASQIPVEDAIPTVLRAPQAIVVGDEKQLPPTNFFNASSEDDDFDASDEDVDFEINQDSFLTLSAEHLPSTLLGWHYRSRSEELIGFSNAAFYGTRLLTIPSVKQSEKRASISVLDPTTLPKSVPDILSRPISFHHIPNGIYGDRKNSDEAKYIATLMRELLADQVKNKTQKTFGIVAFSEAQQGEIERALNALAEDDSEFATRLETEREREDEGEYIGLFVKNLENVQGDERDIIILSVCYGPTVSGKMRMNFGPINKPGGEKRLNVIFSRSKLSMMIVSTITHAAITNDYNFGANALKTYLRYAEALSIGQVESAKSALFSIASQTTSEYDCRESSDAIHNNLAEQLAQNGWKVERNFGLSSFKIDLALSSSKTGTRVAILIDTPQRYRTKDVVETFTARANILEAFGWKVLLIPLSQIWDDYESVMERIEKFK